MSLIIFFSCLVLSAFFSGMEIAFVSSNKLRLELDKKRRPLFKKMIAYFSEEPQEFIATMLIGNNIALVIFGIYATEIFQPLVEHFAINKFSILLFQTLISTLIILTTAEFFPKSIFRMHPNFFLKVLILPVAVFYILFYPITKFSMLVSNGLLTLFSKKKLGDNDSKKVFNKLDLDELISQNLTPSSEAEESEHGVQIIKNALDFSEIKLKECMKPRAEIVAVEFDQIEQKIQHKFINTGYSKVLIFKETIDHIIGYIHHAQLFEFSLNELAKNIIKPVFAPETMPAQMLLSSLLQERKSIAVVVDEFGGTAGVVTVEDILEEIIGDIQDEHDSNNLIESKISDTEYIFSGRLEIDSLNEKYQLDLPESDQYETIAGMLLYYYENFPKINDVVEINHFHFKIINSTNHKIHLVKLSIQPD